MWLSHALVQHRSAAAADIESKPVPEEPVTLIGHQCFAVLPAEADVV